MKRYKPLFEKQLLFEWTYSDEKEYLRFCEYVIASNYGELLIEWKLFPELKEKIEFIKELAIQTGFKIKDLFKLFMNKVVFKFFKLIGWSMTNLFDLLKKDTKHIKHSNQSYQNIFQIQKSENGQKKSWKN